MPFAEREVRPFGAWASPVPTRLLVEKRLSLADVRFVHGSGAVTWLESRPWEDGRQVLVHWAPGPGITDLTADDLMLS
jgi:hypothetical protein